MCSSCSILSSFSPTLGLLLGNLTLNSVEWITFAFIFSGDDVVPYKFGEKSSKCLSSTGFGDVTFKAYTG